MEQLEQRVETHQHHQACRIAALECYFAFLIYLSSKTKSFSQFYKFKFYLK